MKVGISAQGRRRTAAAVTVPRREPSPAASTLSLAAPP